MSILLLEQATKQNRKTLIEHEIYSKIQGLEDLKIFMRSHVFAVWDFMSLLKTLQNQITCVNAPWLPPQNNLAARLINEIVVAEESDEVAPGIYKSHFELYLDAMAECQADTQQIKKFVELLKDQSSVEISLKRVDEASSHISDFVLSTMEFCSAEPHKVAAAFLYGREDLIPDMFRRILLDVEAIHQTEFSKLKFYLERHISLDSESHGPLSKLMMETLCGTDLKKWDDAISIANKAIEARILFWDGCYKEIKNK
jgi:Protein of unknown function (DUF3050)